MNTKPNYSSCPHGGSLIRRATLILAAAWPLVANAQNDVPKWSVHEITLTGTGSHKNPYTDVTVTATFSGPGGLQKTVKGFWDGGNTFRIRFTPTRQGSWSWSSSSSDASLNGRSGAVNCTAPDAGNHGFLRVDAANPYSFVWDDGNRYFMWGNTYYAMVYNAVANGGWKTAIDNTAAHGLTKVRMTINEFYSGSLGAPGEKWEPYAYSSPFLLTDATTADFDRLNLPHWQAIDTIISYAESKGLVVDLLFMDYDYQTPGNTLYFGTQAQDERYYRYALARYGAYHNVIWCLDNEWNYAPKPQSYWNAIGVIVNNEDPWRLDGGNRRPLSIHQQTRIDFNFFASSWPTHAIIQYGVRNKETDAANEFKNTRQTKYHHGDEWGNASIVYNLGHNKPIVNDEYGYVGEAEPVAMTQSQARYTIWGTAVAGGYGSHGDWTGYGPSGTYRSAMSGDWRPDPSYGDLQRLISFFTTKGLEYWKMSSQNSLKTSGTRVYVLAETGRQYLIYAAVGGTFSLNVASGTYMARQYNPRTGEDATLAELTGGGSRSFTMPDANDWVVYLKAKAR
jgi:Domain of unknown function (DUF5060)/Protein of unknown function (DUF4038)/Putative collagen-binding domain of a collagenase